MTATLQRAFLCVVVLVCPLWCGAGAAAGPDPPASGRCCCCHHPAAPTGPSQLPPTNDHDDSACQCFCGGAVVDKEAGPRLPLDDAGPFDGSIVAAILADRSGTRLVLPEPATSRECAQPGRAVCLRAMRFLC
ncbi:MAG: hypothetical protein WD066_18215 [Planctomycetaceae bacterium]